MKFEETFQQSSVKIGLLAFACQFGIWYILPSDHQWHRRKIHIGQGEVFDSVAPDRNWLYSGHAMVIEVFPFFLLYHFVLAEL